MNRVPSFPDVICLIIDPSLSTLDPEEIALQALRAGVRFIQYREKEKTRGEIYSEAVKLRRAAADFGAALIINDHADIAAAVDADGVHLGQEDLPLREARKIMGERLIGISTHSPGEAAAAAAGGADYIGFGPVFYTSTKDAGQPRGVAMVKEVKANVPVPVVAIGGITHCNILQVLEAGADAVAVASAILKGDIADNIASLRELIKKFSQFNAMQDRRRKR
jgi:thiamine-phosphate pyrophosphorylase